MTPNHDPTRTANPDATRTAEPRRDDATVTAAPAPPGAIDAPPGTVVEREIGLGGMGVVYLARQIGLNRPVALKLVKGGEKVDAKALIRFLAEAEAVAAVKHPNVVEVYQYGEYQGRPYLALEYCPGGDLTSLVIPTRKRGAGEPGDGFDLVSREATPSASKDWFRKVADLMA